MASIVVDKFNEAGPIRSLPETAARTASSPGFSDIEDEETAWLQGLECATEQPGQRRAAVAAIEGVVEDFPQSGDGDAIGEI